MKKVLLTLLTLLSLNAYGVVEKEVTINFNQFPQLTMSPAFNFSSMSNNGQTNCTTYKVLSSPITISFSVGKGTLGAAIYRVDDYYALLLRSFCDMIFEVSGGCQLTSIKFYNNNSIAEYSVGRFDILTNEWLPNGATNVSKVVLSNGIQESQLSKVTIKYTTPATPLTFSSSTPAAGSSPNSFKSMQVNFNVAVTKVNSGNVTLTSSTFTGSKALTASANGRAVTLTSSETLTDAGSYTVHIPAGIFETAEGATNDAKDITFTIVPKRDTFVPTADPASGTVTSLPQTVTLTFPNYVKIGTGTVKFKRSDNSGSFSAAVAVNTANQKQVLITHDHNEVEAASWTVEIPEKLFHTDFPETDADYIWNPAQTLTYTVDGSQFNPGPQDSETMKAAKELLQKTGVGYPLTTSEAYQALNTLVNAAETPADEALATAMTALYNSAEVTMPEVGKWYSIAAVNALGSKIYLTLNEDKTKVLLGTVAGRAAAFKVVSLTGSQVVFQTKEGWFLHVPHSLPNYQGTSKRNLTDEQGDVNKLTLAKFAAASVTGADPKALYGTFSLFGSLGTKNGAEKSAYATVSFDDSDFSTDPDFGLLFNASQTSAFVLEDTTEPVDVVDYVYVSIGLSPSNTIAKVGDELKLNVTGPAATEILDAAKIYFVKDDAKVTLSHPILTASGTPNQFNVDTNGLEAGTTYQLTIEEGAFKYTAPSGKAVKESTLTINVNIQGEAPTPPTPPTPSDPEQVRPEPSLSTTTLAKAGDQLTLTINNVTNAKLQSGQTPYFKYASGASAGQKVSTSGNVLTVVGTSKTQFAVNTAMLPAGTFTLVMPSNTFIFEVEEGKELIVSEMTIDFTIQEQGQTTPTTGDFQYKDWSIVIVTQKYRMANNIDIIRDVDLNDLVIGVYDFMGYSALCGSPEDGKVTIRSTFGGNLVEGHFETLSSTELIKKYGNDYQGFWALKFVPKNPIKAGDLDDRSGYYGYYFDNGAFGDANYKKYLAGNKNVKASDCIVNSATAGPIFYVNNDRATGISTITTDAAEQVIYDLQGRRVTVPAKKGIYIINGKKTVIK